MSLGTTGVVAGPIKVNSSAFFNVSNLSSTFTLGSGSTQQKMMGTGTVTGNTTNGMINGANGLIIPGTDGTAGTLEYSK